MIHVVTTQYAIELLPNWQSFTEKMNALVSQAKSQVAQLLILPEYAGVEGFRKGLEKTIRRFTHVENLMKYNADVRYI